MAFVEGISSPPFSIRILFRLHIRTNRALYPLSPLSPARPQEKLDLFPTSRTVLGLSDGLAMNRCM